jgi:methylmalonyl-CoA mutase N-terminal domain/subunit
MRRPVYTPDDLQGMVVRPSDTPDPVRAAVHARAWYLEGYAAGEWTIRQFAGFGAPPNTNRRYRELLAAGGTGLSVAFDLPTLMGRDPDHELSRGGGESAAAAQRSRRSPTWTRSSTASTGRVSTSMTINSPAPMLLAMYLVVAERRGVPWAQLNGTLQNDILKEFIAQKEYIYPPGPSVRLVVDTMAFCADQVPRWNSISGQRLPHS